MYVVNLVTIVIIQNLAIHNGYIVLSPWQQPYSLVTNLESRIKKSA